MLVPFFVQQIFAVFPKRKAKAKKEPTAVWNYSERADDHHPYWRSLHPLARTQVDHRRLAYGNRPCPCTTSTFPTYRMDTLDGSLYLICQHGKHLNVHTYLNQ